MEGNHRQDADPKIECNELAVWTFGDYRVLPERANPHVLRLELEPSESASLEDEPHQLLLDRLVCLLEDVRLARIELAVDAFDDVVALPGEHDTLQCHEAKPHRVRVLALR